jgi:hypothetical protein
MAVRYGNGSSCSWSSAPPAPCNLGRVVRRAAGAQAVQPTFLAVPTQAAFQELPPRQKAASFTVDQIMGKLLAGIARRQP